MTITVANYLMGRDKAFARDFTPAIMQQATVLVALLREVISEAQADDCGPGIDSATRTHVASGWRPPAVNDRTANAATKSSHMTGEGCDLQDFPDRRLARWCLRNVRLLERLGLWMEDPRWTAGKTGLDPWVHLQMKAPRSGKRVYVPSTEPPQCGPLAP